jgi:Xaa-Pro aminopeptidase
MKMDYQTDFAPAELAQRRRQLATGLEVGTVALVPGAAESQGSEAFRQVNDFYYLCGVEVPHAYLLIAADGLATLFLAENPHHPVAVENAPRVKSATGLDAVLPLTALAQHLQRQKVVYLPGREAEGSRMSWDTLLAWRKAMINDPFDGRVGRNVQVASRLQQYFPLLELRDLSPLIDELRLIKSPSELVLMRRAGELTALGALAAMRATRPGMMEYQLRANMLHTYIDGGAIGEAYSPIIPGTANAGDAHYHANNCELTDGDIVLVDCAPDYRYYTSDIGRMWPVNGVFSPAQRALYGYVLAYHKAVLAAIRPGRMRSDVHCEAAAVMSPVFERWDFASADQRETARILFTFTGHISHGVGMAVHDVSQHYDRPLAPGMVFAVDPMAWDHQRNTFYRVEDTVLVTENGCETLTATCPIEIDEIEATMAAAR